MISCKEAVARLWTHLDRNLGGPQERELEEHLGLCRHCCGELEFARRPGRASAWSASSNV